jgi:pSer/pThr/pTyr-binding forkhead associated (FHA) protein
MTGSTSDESSSEVRRALADAESRGGALVVYWDDGGHERIFNLPDTGTAITVGRTTWADIPLPWDDQVSRLHAQFERVADDWTLVDEGLSRNGTFVNGQRIEGRRRLGDGDELRFGGTKALYRSPGQLGGSETVIVDVTPPPEAS